jgi:RNA-directed DNA polymerase
VAGLLYPSPVDTYCKTICRCKYYGRYMDDIYIIHPDKAFLQAVFKGMQETAAALRLTFNPRKCRIARIDKGFTYLKGNYRLTETGKVLCSPHRKTLTRERHRLKRMPKEALPEAYRAWRGNILRQFPTMPFQTLQNFDRLYGGIQHDIPAL